MDKKLTVIFSSHRPESENEEFKQHIKDTVGKGIDLEVICIENYNQYALTQAYNIGWKKAKEMGRDYGCLVFCHNDIIFNKSDWGDVLMKLFIHTDYDIIGIAGTTEIYSHGCWWLLENPEKVEGDKMNRSKMFGKVSHMQKETGNVWTNYYGKTGGVKKVVIADGLFLAVNGSTLGETEEEMFDERFRGFHMYDVSFCFRNYLAGFKIGVTDRLEVTHKSVGETNMEWEANRNMFAELYKDKLPAKV